MTTQQSETPQRFANTPIYSLLGAGMFLLTLGVIVVTGHDQSRGGSLLFVLAMSTLPSLLASIYSERVSRDVRNGVVEDKARMGTHRALQEAQVVTRDGPAMTLAMQALREIIGNQHDAAHVIADVAANVPGTETSPGTNQNGETT